MLNRILRKLNHHRTTEAYFVGYPKTGNTWLRYMLGRYVQLVCNLSVLPLFDAADRFGRCERFCVGPAIQFTHRPLLWGNQRATDLNYGNVIRPFENKRVVLLVRYPLDASVSLWMQRKHQNKETYRGNLPEFLEDPIWGLEKQIRFYSLWFAHRGDVKNFLLLRYEDLRANPTQVFGDLLRYLDIPRQDALLARAIADADFNNMKKVEALGAAPKYRSSGFSIFATGDTSNPDEFHVRRGKVGGFRDYIEGEAAKLVIERVNRDMPTLFGYSNESWQRRALDQASLR